MKNNTVTQSLSKEKKYRRIIIALSIAIPVAVALLFRIRVPGVDLSFLPPIYATINGLTSVLLLIALLAIKSGRVLLHERLMKTCLALSAAFLLMYVAYHITSDPTPYGGQGVWKNIYYVILISHIVLSIFIVPLVLFTYLRAILGKFELHRKLARITFPLWWYVAVTGVIVYLMISPYYA